MLMVAFGFFDVGIVCKAGKRKADVSNYTKVGHGIRILHCDMHHDHLWLSYQATRRAARFTGNAGDKPLATISSKINDYSELQPYGFCRACYFLPRRRAYYGPDLDCPV